MKRTDQERAVVPAREPDVVLRDRPVLITGGAGFIGCNVANRLLTAGHRVILYDNLSRAGVERNVTWLREKHGDRVQVVVGDVRDAELVRSTVQQAGRVFHFAAQVAVTTSLDDPVEDFSVNARGTLNVLEAIRATEHRPPLVFTSTNKVYGGLDDVGLVRVGDRYTPADEGLAATGIDERRPLDFHSPYGCSKGTADQYVVDYARSYGLKTAVFRMSCIYGPHQFGTEDQGWVAHFLIRALDGQPIMLYGDGRQVRDILFVEDLVDAMLLAQRNIDRISGQAFNIGGGAGNTISLLELLDVIGEIHGDRPDIAFRDWRTGDQLYYVSNTAKFSAVTGWKQTVGVEAGVHRLYQWLVESRGSESKSVRRQRDSALVDTEVSDATSSVGASAVGAPGVGAARGAR
jgi:CDP-paratose 2-epimerase